MNEKLIGSLLKLGFTEYEARAYLVIIQLNLSSAREIIEISGLPRGKIYSTLNQLAEKGYIGVKEGNPALYYPINPVETIALLKKQVLADFSELEENIIAMSRINNIKPSLFWEMPNLTNIKNKVRNFIRSAKEDIFILLEDPEMYPSLENELFKIRKKIKISILVPDNLNYLENKFNFHHMNEKLINFFDEMDGIIEEDLPKHFPKRNLSVLIIIDSRKSLIAIHEPSGYLVGISYDALLIFTQKKLIETLAPEIFGK